MNLHRLVPLAASLLLLQGCLPYGCNRTESRALVPEDSVSRTIAERMPVDTLEAVDAPELEGLDHPRTVRFAADGTLYLTDVGADMLWGIGPDGSTETVRLPDLGTPYLAGFRDGLPVVFSPEAGRLVAIGPEGEAWSATLPGERAALQYAVATDSGAWVKRIGPDAPGRVLALDRSGAVRSEVLLTGPYWRWAGHLRMWQGRVASLSGYRPWIFRVDRDPPDSLRLAGFDSPMLARSRAFLLGDVDRPPLLTASAAPLDSLLYVLNMRPGWLRVDVFGPDGRLRQILVEPMPAFNTEFYPNDLDVRRLPDGRVELAVTVVDPVPSLRRYRTR